MSGNRLKLLAALPVLLWGESPAVSAPAPPGRSHVDLPEVGLAPIGMVAREWLFTSSAETSVALLLPLPGAPQIGDDGIRDDWDLVDRSIGGSLSPGGEVSVLRAIAASALVPGLGERLAGRGDRAKFFHVAEAAIWSTFAFYRIQGTLRSDRYREFAFLKAGASPEGNDDYYEHIGFWLSLGEWHEIVRRDARLRFPDDPAAQEGFFQKNKRYEQGESWEWADDGTRTRYRQLRSRSERSFRNARMAIGAAVFNRLASIIDTLALTRSHNREVRERRARLELRLGPRVTVDGLVIGPVLSAKY